MSQGKSSTGPDDVATADEAMPRAAELARVRIILTREDEIPTVALITDRLWHVRQLYALFFLLRVAPSDDEDLVQVAILFLGAENKIDLETVVPIKLELRSAGLGSFWTEIVNVAKEVPALLPQVSAAAAASLMAVGVLFKQGREIFWRNQTTATIDKETQTKVNQAEGAAKIARADAERAKAGMDEHLVPFNAVIDSLKRIEDLKDPTPEQKEVLQKLLFHEVDAVFGPKSAETLRDLPPPNQQIAPPEPPEPGGD